MSTIERNARLHLPDRKITAPARRVLRPARVPPAPVRVLPRLAVKAGRQDWERRFLDPLVSARAQSGLDGGPPRFRSR